MLRSILITLATLSLVTTVVQADVTIYVEDFDEQGNAGFDPMFNHDFSVNPGIEHPSWIYVLGMEEDRYSLCLGAGTTDTITFNLPSSEIVTNGEVVLEDAINNFFTLVRFVGSESIWETGPDDNGKKQIEISSDQIGNIEQIELYSTQGQSIFLSVSIGVVPEPGSSCLLIILIGSALLCRFLARN